MSREAGVLADFAVVPDVNLVVEFDAATKKVTVSGKSETLKGHVFVQTSADGERIVTRERGGSRITLRDGKTAAILATLREGPDIAGAWPFFLSDGRCALALSDGESASIEMFSVAGVKAKSIPLPSRGRIRPGLEAAPGQIAVSLETESRGNPTSVSTLYRVDADRGVAKQVAEGLRPIALPFWSRPPMAPGSEAMPPTTAPTRMAIDSSKRKLSGATNSKMSACSAPATPV